MGGEHFLRLDRTKNTSLDRIVENTKTVRFDGVCGNVKMKNLLLLEKQNVLERSGVGFEKMEMEVKIILYNHLDLKG